MGGLKGELGGRRLMGILNFRFRFVVYIRRGEGRLEDTYKHSVNR